MDAIVPKKNRHERRKAEVVAEPAEATLKIDLGCGPNPREGFVGVDRIKFSDKVVHVVEIGSARWPFEDGSVIEVHCSHMLEHLTAVERCHFFNELDRVLAEKGKAVIITPHWSSSRAYGDPTHQWPPMGEMFWYYLDREWRASQAPHTDAKYWPQGYNCHLQATWGYSVNPEFLPKAEPAKQFAIAHHREAIWDMQATVSKKT